MIEGKKMRHVLKFMLYCGCDARSLGIEDDHGQWNLTALKRHIKECEPCKTFCTVRGIELLEGLEKAFRRAKRETEGSQKGGCPQPKHKAPDERSTHQ